METEKLIATLRRQPHHIKNLEDPDLLSSCLKLLVTRQEILTSIDDTGRDNIYHDLIKIMIHIDFLHFRTTLDWRGYRNNWNLCPFLEDKAVRDVYYDSLRVLLEESSELFMAHKVGSEKYLYLIMREIIDLELSVGCGMIKLDVDSEDIEK
ncbi:7a800087-5466-4c0d-936f-a1cc938aff75 [Sclerotinia trifoliorum]|uniref:7a800087-5466-4c0d-936f-a1cc938aff75 n=1 Tax=Sclerotinia trifoliorum TaxID=28548 RepID=A0A8H2VR72_9HELO|nr:7a800087-5466-4c0d-936f-a1cc938aff75 [Sclerotinia trifoliorum]